MGDTPRGCAGPFGGPSRYLAINHIELQLAKKPAPIIGV